jgi:hypothetical protein
VEVVSIRRAAVIFYVQLERTNPYRKAKNREITERLVGRYGFLKFPKTYEEHNDTENGVLFADGVYDGIEIPELRIFSNGFLVGTGESTDVAERLFGDMVSIWQDAGLDLSPKMVANKAYISQMVVKSDIDLLSTNPALAAVVENWFPRGNAGIGSVGIFTNGNAVDNQPPVRIERLVGMPLEAMQFWSQAPLPTVLHLSFLTRWETVLRPSPSSSGEP